MLTTPQAQVARRVLGALIDKNNTVTNAALRSHGTDPQRWPNNVTFENQQRTDENAALQGILDNLATITA